MAQTVAQAQTMMNLIDPSVKLKVDGVAGPKTAAAYKGLESKAMVLVTELVNARNAEAIPVLAATSAPASGSWVSRAEAISIVKQVVGQYGGFTSDMPDAVDYLVWLLDLEPARATINGVLHYDASSKHGSFLGLYQIGPGAYQDVVKKQNLIADLPAFRTAAVNPRYSAYLALQYAKVLRDYLRRGLPAEGIAPYKGKITSEILYAAHNQGAAGLLRGARNALIEKGQSKIATNVIAQAVKQMAA